jgi:hypothetical protein
MDRRRQTRVDSVLPVRVWGVDAYALPFSEIASVKNVSASGAVLQGIVRQIKPGVVLEVQHSGQRAHCRVIWVGITGSRRGGEIGIEFLPAEPSIWGMAFDATMQCAGNG